MKEFVVPFFSASLFLKKKTFFVVVFFVTPLSFCFPPPGAPARGGPSKSTLAS